MEGVVFSCEMGSVGLLSALLGKMHAGYLGLSAMAKRHGSDWGRGGGGGGGVWCQGLLCVPVFV